MILDKFSTKKQSVAAAAATLITAVAFSKVLGLLRDRALAARFGSDDVLGVYFAAFRIPDLVFQLLIMGALSSAFIPVFSKLLGEKDYKKAWKTANVSLSWALLLFAGTAALVIIFAKPLAGLIAPGFTDAQKSLLAQITVIITLAQIFFVLSNFLSGILQSMEAFLTTALAPIFYNLGIIAGILFLTPSLGIFGPAWGVVLGTFLHFLVQLYPALRLGWRPKISLDLKNTQVVKIAKLTLPRLLGQSVAQIDYTVDIILASFISASALIYFNFAQHLQVLPVSLFGASIAQAALPKLSKDAGNITQFKITFQRLFHQLLFLTAPFAVLLLVLRIPLTRLVFGAARFNWEATLQTAYTLSFFAISIVAQGSAYLLARAFYALGDTKTPTKAGIVSIVINSLLSVLFVLGLKLPVWSLALSCSIASIVNAGLLIIMLDRKLHKFERPAFLKPVFSIGVAAFFMGVSLFLPLKLLDALVLDTTRVWGLLVLTGLTTLAGLGVYILISLKLNIPQLALIAQYFKKQGVFPQNGLNS
ncbi:MAG: murein biosynthesis integral membrane protein MurJ [bacterium]